MIGTAGSRLDYYQTLGVSPTAAGDEIDRAFAREGSVFRPHAFGALAELCIAYETLRDPIKRRAYDASLGLTREPQATESINGGSKPVRGDGGLDAIAAAARPALPLGPGTDYQARPEPRISRGDLPRLALEEELGVEAHPIDWNRTGIALGTVVVAACVLGGLAGWWSAGDVDGTRQPENQVSISLPPAKPLDTAATPDIAPAPGPLPKMSEVRLAQRPAAAPVPIERKPTTPKPAAAEEQPQEAETDTSLVEQVSKEAPTASTVAAAMPLPGRVIARTIARIGYSCGSVASTAPVEGEAPGVFKVTCSSGQSYQAKPVNGRYHFRRWGRQ